MNKYLSMIVLIAVGLFAIPMSASADPVPFNETAIQYGTGIDPKPLMPLSTHLCFLTGVDMSDVGADNEQAECEVGWNSTHWWLEARVLSGDASVFCTAFCYTYD